MMYDISTMIDAIGRCFADASREAALLQSDKMMKVVRRARTTLRRQAIHG